MAVDTVATQKRLDELKARREQLLQQPQPQTAIASSDPRSIRLEELKRKRAELTRLDVNAQLQLIDQMSG